MKFITKFFNTHKAYFCYNHEHDKDDIQEIEALNVECIGGNQILKMVYQLHMILILTNLLIL